MYYNPFSRRYFLRGMGVSLALPFLPSIMREAYAATGAAPRYIQVLSSFGQYGSMYYPSDNGLVAQAGSGVFAQPLKDIGGDISTIFGSEFSPYKNKMSLVRGMDVLAGSNLHNGCMPTCASGTFEDNEANGRPVYPYSVDTLIADSAKIYPDPTGKQRNVNFCPADQSYQNFSWTKQNGAVQHQPNTNRTDSLLAKFAPLSGAQAASPSTVRKANVIQSIFADYTKVRDSVKISSNDKSRLESYIALIDQTSKGLQAQAGECKSPSQEPESNSDATTRNQINVLVAAMACQLTRVANIVLSVPYDPIHGYSHNGQANEHAALQKAMGQHVAYLMKQMDSLNEASGTMLDNAVVYWGNEFGENNNGDPHRMDNNTAMIAGGGAGALQMGYYINYGKTQKRPFNNMMITFLNAMGLSSGDYERDGIVGVGEYNQGAINGANMGAFTSDAEKRKPLPFLYKGPVRG